MPNPITEVENIINDVITTKCLEVGKLPTLDDLNINLKIDPKDVTNGHVETFIEEGTRKELKRWVGTGLLDSILMTINANMSIQQENGRITGPDYAVAYASIVGSAIQYAFDAAFKNRDLELRAAQINADIKVKYEELRLRYYESCLKKKMDSATLKSELLLTKLKQENMKEQTNLYVRQIIGFDDNMFIKLLQAQLDAFSMIYSSGMLDDPTMPAPINANELKDIYTIFKTRAQEVKKYNLDTRIIKPESSINL